MASEIESHNTSSLHPGRPRDALSSRLPRLIFGCTTFNNLYNSTAESIDSVGLVQHALQHGISAFDTSPYYGPSETILGAALDTPWIRANVSRESYHLITKVGRISSDTFDYSPSAVRKSVASSLERLRTPYLDLVYCHDVEFVSDDETLAAIAELRRIRDTQGTIKYVGITGYPIAVLARLAKRVLAETGEPLDAVLSYAQFTLQNQLLASHGVQSFKDAQVDVVLNGSMLGMGMLRRSGVPVGGQGDWHPAPSGLRAAVRDASDFCDANNARLEDVAVRYALENWLSAGATVGSTASVASDEDKQELDHVNTNKLGVSLMGVSTIDELRQTLQLWHSICADQDNEAAETAKAGSIDDGNTDEETHSILSRQRNEELSTGVRQRLDKWLDYTWDSPSAAYYQKSGRIREAQ